MVNILVIDDHPIVRQGIIRIIEDIPDFSVSGEAGSWQEAFELLRKNSYDLVILDISLPDVNGIDILISLKRMKHKLPVPVLILTMYPERDYAVKALENGAAGYLTKDKAPAELVEAIQTLLSGKKYFGRDFADLLQPGNPEFNVASPERSLSNREFQVMSMISAGKSVKEIAYTLSLSVKTISTHRSHILAKLNLKNNAQIMRYALKNNSDTR